MGQQVSPGIEIREFDLTTVVPAVSTSTGAFAGVFRWGPVDKPVLVDSENYLVQRFHTPSTWNAETWFTAASFLAYTNALYIVRAANVTSNDVNVAAHTAYANITSVTNALSLIVKNEDHYSTLDGTFESGVCYVARYPGEVGNSLRISTCFTGNAYTRTINLQSIGSGAVLTMNINSNTATLTINSDSVSNANANAVALAANLAVTDLIELGNNDIGIQYLKITEIEYNANTDAQGNATVGNAVVTIHFEEPLQLHTAINESAHLTRFWEFFSLIGAAPGQSDYVAQFGNASAQDEMHVVVVDDKGKFSGVPGTVLEVYRGLSRATDAVGEDGLSNYYKDVINQRSAYVWWTNDHTSAVSNTAENVVTATVEAPVSLTFSGGNDGAGESNVAPGIIARGYDHFRSAEDIDISLILTGRGLGGINGSQIPNYIVDNICEVRKDCVVFISPPRSAVVDNAGQELDDIIDFRNNLRSTSYGFLDSGYKYMYDRYNDVYRWIPLNGDMAGLAARCDKDKDAWWSFAGFNRGQIKNIVKLAWNPRKAQRDVLYPAGVNPVVTFPQQGTVLYGDKTLLAKPSAFDRINVRRLFIVIEKAIAYSSQFFLFEFNDPFTRAQFRNMVNPYLRDIKGRRGITDFLVVADETNNPGQVIDTNRFVGDIYVKPARSINFIQLNFIAVPTGIAFTEVVGRFG